MKEKIIYAFNQLAQAYEHTVDVDSPMNTDYERPAMIQLLSDNLRGLTILDAGCAAGWYTHYFLEKEAIVTAIDLSPKMIDAAKRRIRDRADIFCHDLTQPLPFSDQTF